MQLEPAAFDGMLDAGAELLTTCLERVETRSIDFLDVDAS